MPASTVTRFSLNLPPKLAAALERLAEEEGITKTELVRNALSTERFLRERARAGWKLYLNDDAGSIERIVFPYWEEATLDQEAEAPVDTEPSSSSKGRRPATTRR